MKKSLLNSTKIPFAKGPKIAIHIEMDRGVITSSRLSLSSAFTCVGADNALLEWIQSYLNGKSALFPLPSGTPFQQDVLAAMQTIPFGSTLSYKALADLSGYPNAARAVGTVCKKNPFPLFIPCHRVIQSNGDLGGFAYHLEIKKRLLEFEASHRSLPQ